MGIIICEMIDKYQINQLFDVICRDDFRNGLILKLVYVYGRNIGEVLKLRKSDIDFDNACINFKSANVCLPLFQVVADDLNKYIEGVDEYLFIDKIGSNGTNKYSNQLNKYLNNFIDYCNKNDVLGWKCPTLVCTDFKVLRGQHLFLDGANINVINELYSNKNIGSTKKLIDYRSLLKLRFTISDLDDLIDYTDLGVFKVGSFDDTVLFTVIDDGVSVVVEYDTVYANLSFVDGDMFLFDLINAWDFNVWDGLCDRLNDGFYCFVDGVKIIRY